MRLSIMSFAGIVRTLVAVGTVRLASMLVASVLLIPLSWTTVASGSAAGSVPSGMTVVPVAGASAGIGCGLAGAEVVRATGVVPVGGAAGSAARSGGRLGARPPGSLDDGGIGPRRCRVVDGVVALEDRPPALVDRVLVDEVPLVHLVDEPFVGSELARGSVVGCDSGHWVGHSRPPTLSFF